MKSQNLPTSDDFAFFKSLLSPSELPFSLFRLMMTAFTTLQLEIRTQAVFRDYHWSSSYRFSRQESDTEWVSQRRRCWSRSADVDEPLMSSWRFKVYILLRSADWLKISAKRFILHVRNVQNSKRTSHRKWTWNSWEVRSAERSEAPSIEFQDVSGERHSQLTACTKTTQFFFFIRQ